VLHSYPHNRVSPDLGTEVRGYYGSNISQGVRHGTLLIPLLRWHESFTIMTASWLRRCGCLSLTGALLEIRRRCPINPSRVLLQSVAVLSEDLADKANVAGEDTPTRVSVGQWGLKFLAAVRALHQFKINAR
jgi:hypothetical protein